MRMFFKSFCALTVLAMVHGVFAGVVIPPTITSNYSSGTLQTLWVYRESFTDSTYHKGERRDDYYEFHVEAPEGKVAKVVITYVANRGNYRNSGALMVNDSGMQVGESREWMSWPGDELVFEVRSDRYVTSEPGGSTSKCDFKIDVTIMDDGPDLEIDDAYLTPLHGAMSDETVMIHVKVRNVGAWASSQGTVSLADGQAVVGQAIVPALQSMESQTCDFDLSGLVVGNHTKLRVMVQPLADEETTANNSRLLSGYGIYARKSYVVKFNGNGADSGSMANQGMVCGTARNLTANGFARKGYSFLGWSRNAAAASPEFADRASVDKLTFGNEVELFAVWSEIPKMLIRFWNTESNSSDGMADIQCESGSSVTLPVCGFVKDGYTCIGWTNVRGGGTAVFRIGETVSVLSSGQHYWTVDGDSYTGERLVASTYGSSTSGGFGLGSDDFYGRAHLSCDYFLVLYPVWGRNVQTSAASFMTLATSPGAPWVWQSELVRDTDFDDGLALRSECAYDMADGRRSLLPGTSWIAAQVMGPGRFRYTAGFSGLYSNGFVFHLDGNLQWIKFGPDKGMMSDGMWLPPGMTCEVGEGNHLLQWTCHFEDFSDNAAYRKDDFGILQDLLFQPADYRIRYHANAAAASGAMREQYMYCGESAKLIRNAFSRSGYAFAGWMHEAREAVYADGEEVVDIAYDGVVDLLAIWLSSAGNDAVICPSSARFVPSEGIENAVLQVVASGSWTVSAASSWIKVAPSGGSGKGVVSYSISANDTASERRSTITVTCGSCKRQLEIVQAAGHQEPVVTGYDVTYSCGPYGSGTVAPDRKIPGVTLTLKGAVFTRTGYVQTGWSRNVEGDTKDYDLGAGYTRDEEMTIFPYWTANVHYEISYLLDGGSLLMPGPTSAIFGSWIGVEDPVRTGYDFVGWTVSEGLDPSVAQYAEPRVSPSKIGDRYVLLYKDEWHFISDSSMLLRSFKIDYNELRLRNLTAVNGGRVTLTAHWNKKVTPAFLVYFLPGAYGKGSPVVLSYGGTSSQTPFLPGALFTQTGYVQTGWSKDSYGSTRDYGLSTSDIPSETINLYPYWTKNQYSVDYELAGGSHGGSHPALVSFGETFVVSDPTKPGYKFLGWCVTEGLDPRTAEVLNPDTTVAYVTEGTDVDDGLSHAIKPIKPIRPFEPVMRCSISNETQLCKGSAGAHETEFKDLTPVENGCVTLTAHWAVAEPYEVLCAPGSLISGEERSFRNQSGVAMTLPEALFVRTGYRQTGWSKDINGSTKDYELGASYEAGKSVTLFPYWTANQYSVFYSLDGGVVKVPNPSSACFDESFMVIEPTRTGYSFLGWTVVDGLDPSLAEYTPCLTYVVVKQLEYGVLPIHGGNPDLKESASWFAIPGSSELVRGDDLKVWFRNLTSDDGGVVTLMANWEKVVEQPSVEPPEEPEVNPWRVDFDFSASVANTYDGYLIDEDNNLVGVVQVKAAKQSVKKDVVTITATASVTDANGKKWSYSKGTATVEGAVTGLKCTAKGCPVEEFGVTLGKNGMEGEWGECAIFGARNGMGTKGDAMMSTLEAYKGKWSVTLSVPVGEDADGTVRLQLNVQARGAVKIAGNWERGAKVSASAQMVMGDGFAYIPVMVKATKASPALNALLRVEGEEVVLVGGCLPTPVAEDGDGMVLELLAGGRTVEDLGEPVYLPSEVSAGGRAFSARVAVNELAYPAKFAAKKLPAGLKIDSATGVISGTPTKPGHYVAEVTVTSGLSSKAKKTLTVEFDIANYTDGLIPIRDSYGPYYVGVSAEEGIAAAAGCSVSGLPAGLKWTAKDIADKKTKAVRTAANAVYGVPTKACTNTVYFKRAVKEEVNGKMKSVTHQASATFVVEGMQPWAIGTFNGGGADGIVTLAVAKTGKLSGKWMSEGLTWTLSAASFDAYISSKQMYVATVIGKSGKLAMTNEVVVTENGVVAYDVRGGDSAPTTWEAWRNGWKENPLTTLAPKLKGRTVQVGEVLLTVCANGAVTAKGSFVTGFDEKKQKDITYSASCSTVLIPTAGAGLYRVYLYFPPKAGKFDGFTDVVEIGLGEGQ